MSRGVRAALTIWVLAAVVMGLLIAISFSSPHNAVSAPRPTPSVTVAPFRVFCPPVAGTPAPECVWAVAR